LLHNFEVVSFPLEDLLNRPTTGMIGLIPSNLFRVGILGLLLLGSSALEAQALPALTTQPEARVTMAGSVHPRLVGAQVIGQTPAALPMTGMVLALKRSLEAQAQLEQLLAQQQDPTSPRYHQWLTPEQFGQQFGPSQARLEAVQLWLMGQGFTIDGVSPSRMSILFSGSREQVEWAFQTVMMDYKVDGKVRHANATPVMIPSALADVVAGPLSLTDIPHVSARLKKKPLGALGATPEINWSDGTHGLGPGDFATIYDLNPLYSAGTDGTGVSIAIAGQSNISVSDVTYYRNFFGLPANAPSVVLAGADPGLASDEEEALLDTTWSGAVAKGANIQLVIAAPTSTLDGVDLASQYIVDHNLAAILSLSYGVCEEVNGSYWNTWYGNLWAQAAAQGITVCVAAGDSGPAGCDAAGQNTATGGLAVSALASTPYNVAVGGTEFHEGSGTYWASTSAADHSSALGYIPELPWNESASTSGGTELWAGSGGASVVWSRPGWQVVPGSLSSDGMRDLPDISFSAASHDGYAVREGGSWYAFAGTSCSTPSFAGIMGLIVQKYGRQGNPDPTLYRLGNAQYGLGAAPTVYHDITSGNTTVPGLTGFTAVTGYDQATGLGSADVNALITNWELAAIPTGPTITAQPQSQAVVQPATATFSVSAAGLGTLTYQWQVFPPGGSWSDLTLGTGPTTATYITPVTSTTDNGSEFRVAITDGSGQTTTSTPATLGVTISGTAVVVVSSSEPATPVGGKLTLTASVAGNANTGVSWTASGGSLSATTGNTVTWTAPATPETCTITATSHADTSKSASLQLTAKTLDLLGDGGTPDLLDLSVLAGAYGSRAGDSNWNVIADLNGDGVVDAQDLNLFLTLAGF
jgi:subtilase family serine protease